MTAVTDIITAPLLAAHDVTQFRRWRVRFRGPGGQTTGAAMPASCCELFQQRRRGIMGAFGYILETQLKRRGVIWRGYRF